MDLPTSATMYSVTDSLEHHRLRLLAAERNPEMRFAPIEEMPSEVRRLTPDHFLPCLIDKSIIIHGQYSLENFLLERYPGANLLGPEPMARAKVRMLCENIRDWYGSTPEQLRLRLSELARALRPNAQWFNGQTYSLIDVATAPLLWRASQTDPLNSLPTLAQYKQALFTRENFKLSQPHQYNA